MQVSFPFTIDQLTVEVPDGIEPQYWQQLQSQIGLTLFSLMSKLTNTAGSPLSRFNQLAAGEELKIDEQLADFLQLNHKLMLDSDKQFNPFSGYSNKGFELDISNKAVVKADAVQLDPEPLVTQYIVDQIDSLLASKKLPGYWLSTYNLHINRGDKPNSISFDHPFNSEQIEMQISNEAALIEIGRHRRQAKPAELPNPFANHLNSPTNIACIAESGSACTAKVVSLLALDTNIHNDLQQLASKWHSGFTLFLAEGNTMQYHP